MYVFCNKQKKKMNDFEGISREDLLKLLPKMVKPGFELTDECKRFLESEQNACKVKLPISPSRVGVVLKRSPNNYEQAFYHETKEKNDDLR